MVRWYGKFKNKGEYNKEAYFESIRRVKFYIENKKKLINVIRGYKNKNGFFIKGLGYPMEEMWKPPLQKKKTKVVKKPSIYEE